MEGLMKNLDYENRYLAQYSNWLLSEGLSDALALTQISLYFW